MLLRMVFVSKNAMNKAPILIGMNPHANNALWDAKLVFKVMEKYIVLSAIKVMLKKTLIAFLALMVAQIAMSTIIYIEIQLD